MPRIVALYGPPGSGKSTVVQLAKQRGVEAHDAEAFGASHAERMELLTFWGLEQLG